MRKFPYPVGSPCRISMRLFAVEAEVVWIGFIFVGVVDGLKEIELLNC